MSDNGHLGAVLRRWQEAGGHGAEARAAVAEELLRELLLCYEERQEDGQAVAAEELCRACPELLPELQERIGKLQAWDRLTQPRPQDPSPPAPGPSVTTAAHYRALRFHARGGLGEVFLAQDAESQRTVALKLIRKRCAADPKGRSRFLRERQITGQLEHPGIVSVYGSGEASDGRPFYAMRFVQGTTLAEAIARFHRRAGAGGDPGARALAFRELLTRFVAVCKTVGYAHSRGILHRDLKPDNIMLGDYGETLVMDWGLAKPFGPGQADAEEPREPGGGQRDTGETPRDGTQGGLGTRAYRSPEQAAGEWGRVGTASDVYSLGATLYHLLTGEPPALDGRETAAETTGEAAEPVTRRRGKKRLPRALEAICARAMAPRPEGRYATAVELASDVEHWLADEPVTCYREPLHRRLGRWRRRHPALAAGLAVLLLAAVSVGAWLKREQDAVERDVLEALTEVQVLQEQGKWADGKAALERARGRLAGGGPEGLRQWVKQAELDLGMVAELEEVRLRQTEVKDGKFNLQGADPAYAAAFQRYGVDVLAADPQEAAKRIADSMIREPLIVALDHWAQAKPEADASGRDRLLALARLTDKDQWRRGLRDPAVRKDGHGLRRLAREAGAATQPPVTALILAGYLWQASERAEAVGVLRRAQERHPGDFWLNHTLAAYLLASEPPLREEAIGFYRAAVAVRPQSAGEHVSLGIALGKQGRDKEAVAAYRRALQLKEDYPQAHCNLGAALGKQGRYGEAVIAFRRAIRLKDDYPEAHYNLGLALGKQGRYEEAVAAFRRAIRLKDDFPQAHYNLGLALGEQGRYQKAVAAFRRAIRLKDDYPEAHCHLGLALGEQGLHQEAEAVLRRAIQLKEDYPQAHFSLGLALGEQGRYQKAVAAFRRAIRLKDDFAEAYCYLGLTLQRIGEFSEALAALKRGHALGLKDQRWPHPSEEWVGRCARLVELDGKLSAVLKGEAKPADADRLGFALLCQQYRQRYADAARFYEGAFTANPKLAEDLEKGHRYDAACAAALAGCGRGKDPAGLDAKQRARWRKQAQAWLRADLTLLTRRLESGKPAGRTAVRQALERWASDARLAGVRGAEALGKLPAAERAGWAKLWAEAEALRKQVQEKMN
jgi:serine/threonine-protein kinase